MTVLDLLRPRRRRSSPARSHPVQLPPVITDCRREIFAVTTTFLGAGTWLQMTNLTHRHCRLYVAPGVDMLVPFTVGGHGWVHQTGDWGFALNTAGHWSYIGRYSVRVGTRQERVVAWVVSMGKWPGLDAGVVNPGWASPDHVLNAARVATAAWQSR